MRKILSLIVMVCVICMCSVPVFATETETTPEETQLAIVWTDTNDVVYTTTGLNVRNGPGTEYDVIDQLDVNTKLNRLAVGDNGWSKISCGEADGYVNSKYLTTAAPADYQTEDYPTVQLSDGSIEAIAQAVNSASAVEYTYDYQYFLALDDGNVLVLDTSIADLLSNHVVVLSNGTGYKVFYVDKSDYKLLGHFTDDGSFFVTTPKNASGTSNLYAANYLPTGGSSWVFNISDVLAGKPLSFKAGTWMTGRTFSSASIVYSNKTVYSDVDNSVVYVPSNLTFTISFDTGFADYQIDSQSSLNFNLPTVSYDGYTFEGWYLDSEFTMPYSDTYKFSDNTILYAKWSKIPVISFDTGFEDYQIESQRLDKFTLPDAEYTNYLFLGWFLDPDGTQPFGGVDTVESDLTLYAKWTELPPMAFFSGSIFDGFSALFECEPILYILSIMGLAVIVYVIRMIISSRA